MKKLLYFTAIAVLFSSCSIENLQDESAFDFTNDRTNVEASINSCVSINLINDSNEIKGLAEAIVDHERAVITVRLKSQHGKINASKLYFGSIKNIEIAEADLFKLGKYDLFESFNDGVYTTDYEFSLPDVNRNFGLMAIVYLTNDNISENVRTDGKVVPGINGESYYPDFLENCIK
jgi:hypothetical protein